MVQPVRYLIVLITGFIAGSRAVDALRSWREAAIALGSLLIAGLVWWLLRPRSARKT